MALTAISVVLTIVGPCRDTLIAVYQTHDLEWAGYFKFLQLRYFLSLACDHGSTADCFEFAEWLHWFTSMWLPFMWNDGINTLSDMLTVSSMILSPLTLKYTINSPLHMMLMSLPSCSM